MTWAIAIFCFYAACGVATLIVVWRHWDVEGYEDEEGFHLGKDPVYQRWLKQFLRQTGKPDDGQDTEDRKP